MQWLKWFGSLFVGFALIAGCNADNPSDTPANSSAPLPQIVKLVSQPAAFTVTPLDYSDYYGAAIAFSELVKDGTTWLAHGTGRVGSGVGDVTLRFDGYENDAGEITAESMVFTDASFSLHDNVDASRLTAHFTTSFGEPSLVRADAPGIRTITWLASEYEGVELESAQRSLILRIMVYSGEADY